MYVNDTTYKADKFVRSAEWSLYLFGYDIRGKVPFVVPCYEVYHNGYVANDSVPKHIARRLLRKAIKKSNAVFQEAVESLYF